MTESAWRVAIQKLYPGAMFRPRPGGVTVAFVAGKEVARYTQPKGSKP